MAHLIKKGQIYGTGAAILTINAQAFLDYDTHNSPVDAYFPDTGSYSGCSRIDNYTLTLSNPESDGTCSFSVCYSMDEYTWTTTQISAILFHSLGATNISTTLVGNAIGSSSHILSVLCSSGLVNHYAEFCPNGSSPYNLGDFRWYAHNTPGGCYAGHVAATSVDWMSVLNVKGYASKIFKEIAGQPYSSARVQLLKSGVVKATSSTTDFTTLYGQYVNYDDTNNNDITADVTWIVNVQHYYSGSWVDGASVSWNISYLGNPYDVVMTNQYWDTAGELSITYTSNSSARGKNFRLSVTGHGTATVANSGTPETITRDTGGTPMHNGDAWVLEIDDGGYKAVAHGTVHT